MSSGQKDYVRRATARYELNKLNELREYHIRVYRQRLRIFRQRIHRQLEKDLKRIDAAIERANRDLVSASPLDYIYGHKMNKDAGS